MIYYIEKSISLRFENKDEAIKKLIELKESEFIKINESLYPILSMKIKDSKDGFYLIIETEYEEKEVLE